MLKRIGMQAFDKSHFIYADQKTKSFCFSEISSAKHSELGRVRFFGFDLELIKDYWLTADQVIDFGSASFTVAKNNSERSNLAFSSDSFEDFASEFKTLQDQFSRGCAEKAVPISFLYLDQDLAAPFVELLRNQFFLNGKDTHSLFLIDEDFCYVGFSPEILFERDGWKLTTVALAGTMSAGPDFCEEDFLKNPKERKEHQLVVDSIRSDLQALGHVRTEGIEVVGLGDLYHLQTRIHLELEEDVSNEDLVRLLHPTPALGVYPKKSLREWMKNHNERTDRQNFGAPVLIEKSETQAKCIVGIRSFVFDGIKWKLGAGCGIVAQSNLEQEWSEIILKQNSVLKKLGLSYER